MLLGLSRSSWNVSATSLFKPGQEMSVSDQFVMDSSGISTESGPVSVGASGTPSTSGFVTLTKTRPREELNPTPRIDISLVGPLTDVIIGMFRETESTSPIPLVSATELDREAEKDLDVAFTSSDTFCTSPDRVCSSPLI
jgi:hypothetical protein